jgi:hypothetical protein
MNRVTLNSRAGCLMSISSMHHLYQLLHPGVTYSRSLWISVSGSASIYWQISVLQYGDQKCSNHVDSNKTLTMVNDGERKQALKTHNSNDIKTIHFYFKICFPFTPPLPPICKHMQNGPQIYKPPPSNDGRMVKIISADWSFSSH